MIFHAMVLGMLLWIVLELNAARWEIYRLRLGDRSWLDKMGARHDSERKVY